MVSVSAKMEFSRRSLFLGVILVITITTSIIFFANVEAREYYTHWIISISASTTALLAISIVYQQKHHHRLIEKADVALATALGLSLCAEIFWATNEIILEVVPPVPSLADAFSISAYASLGYYVFSTYLRFYKQFHFNYALTIAAIIASAIFLIFIITQTLNFADLSSYRGIAVFTVIIAYPILDAIIMVPAFLIVINYKKEPQWFTPWVFKSAGIFLVVISDSWFALFVVTSMTNELWPSAMIFAAHNVIIAAGLLWYVLSLATSRTDTTFTRSDNSDSADSNTQQSDIHIPRLNGSKARATSSYIIFFTLAALSVLSIVLIVENLFPSLISIWSLDRLTFFASSDTTEGTHEKAISANIVKIGALLPLSGVSSSSGKSTEAALDRALNDVNAYFSDTNSSIRYDLVVHDTESDPITSLEKLMLLAKDDIRIVVGPATSAELEAVKEYADKKDIIIVSHSSTAPSLAIEGDNIFRFVPNDLQQAQAISRVMWDQGIRMVIPFWRDDIFGHELMQAVRANFEKMGGEFDKDSEKIGYAPRTGQLAASLHRINFIMWDNALKFLESRVQNALTKYAPDKIGVYMVSLDEVTPIFIQAYNHPILSKVKWYGSDGTALNEKLIRNHESALFAVNTSFTNPIYGFQNMKNEELANLLEEIRSQVHVSPSSYSAVAYDIFWVAAMTENITRNIESNVTSNQDIQVLKNALINSANSYLGVTGNTTLDRMGDRAYGEYDYWKVTANAGEGQAPIFSWNRTNW
jgi:ABC-type branched-subunit amino acid transport system substrate-binding protein